ncbi:MAG: carboxypeptidase-like regulatory domain-containing protein, partial [Candidatus Micrarchaeota archaeon]|nr:carboxypeptidase-like regulatory domain-containing protein [Candidatus Micrarchaeota archaeon]
MPKYDEGDDSSFAGKLKAFYYKLEDKYYALLDSLHEKGIDLYKYFVEPIENRGVPSFPVAIALALVILGGVLFGASIIAMPTGTVNISLSTASGSVDGIPVTLVLDGNDFATKSTTDGIVTFSGVPLNQRAQLRVNHPSFQPVLQDIALESAAVSIEIMLASKAPETQDFLVSVLNRATGAPVRGAVISFESLSTGFAGSVTTQPDGTAVIALDPSDSIISLSINAESFETTQRSVLVNDGQLTIQLIPTSGGLNEGGDQATRGTVVVNVKDNLGNFLSANVQIFADDSSEPLASDNVESGIARFENVAPVGTSVYAVVNPSNQAYLSTQSTSQEILAGTEDTEFTVQVENATSANSQVVSISVVSDANVPIQDASVSLFSTSTNQLITKGTTGDSGGSVSFTLSSSIPLENTYVAVNAENYLPLITVISSTDSIIELMPLAAGNNVEFDAEVLDAENQPASGATIELRDATGRLFGINQVAGPDGKVTFAGVQADVSLRLFALLDGATGQSDVFQVAFAENGQRTILFDLERPVGSILVTALNLIDARPVSGALVTAFADSLAGSAVANCTTDVAGTCTLENAWANRELLFVTSASGFESSTSSAQFVSPGQTKHVDVYILNSQFKAQTVINLVSLLDDKGNEVIDFPTIEKGRVYTARFAASFANASQSQGVFVRVGDDATASSDAIVIKSFDYSPSALGTPLAVHSTTYSPGGDCSIDLLNNDVNNNGKKWVEVNYNGVSGVVELSLRVFVKPTADASSDKLSFHYRAFAVQNGKYSRNPYDDELGLDRKTQGKDECYADTIDKEFSLIEGSNVCNSQGTACISVSFNSPEQPNAVGSPFIATINRPFNLNFEIRNFGSIEGSSAYAKIISPSGLVKFLQYSGQGTSSIDDSKTSVRTLFAEARDMYNGSVSSQGVIPNDYSSFKVEFGDARGVIASNARSFAVVQGTGALTLAQLTPSEFEVGKSKDLRLTVKTSAGQPISDATIAFQEENGSPFDGDVPGQIAGD